ncbi:hypothetical protein MKZ38_000170 [Zalerion maritima]|uniref:Helicase C-terminal domain-containing protein n=1 Tax=Zalerion maritima TaxID=339359 RepID=A0AAD5RT61_9PEZI|nr:hypothetical protein MKZ38_000170 [Zalerion maritima]
MNRLLGCSSRGMVQWCHVYSARQRGTWRQGLPGVSEIPHLEAMGEIDFVPSSQKKGPSLWCISSRCKTRTSSKMVLINCIWDSDLEFKSIGEDVVLGACQDFLGVGFSIPSSANYLHLLDPHWNPMVESQAVDRVHRIGQTRDVTMIRYMAKDTIETGKVELGGRN